MAPVGSVRLKFMMREVKSKVRVISAATGLPSSSCAPVVTMTV